jgi:uncharacterized membrane protein YedE/YeeE
MNRSLLAFASAAIGGILFGIGLSIARMTDPNKIWDFLDVAAIPSGGWDPSLAFVMGGGLVVAVVGLRLDRWLGMSVPIAAPAFIKTQRTKVDRPLVVGAAIFGVGWGISGFCPGPSVANLGLVAGDVWPFVAAMFVGSWIAGQFMEFSPAPAASTPA